MGLAEIKITINEKEKVIKRKAHCVWDKEEQIVRTVIKYKGKQYLCIEANDYSYTAEKYIALCEANKDYFLNN